MKQPISIILALPVLIICAALIQKDGLSVLVFVLVFAAMMFAEIRIKHGDLSKSSIEKFFNTPIRHRSYSEKEQEIINKSPRVSVLKGAIIILIGGILVFAILFYYFAFIIN